jgi:hypothetical protein
MARKILFVALAGHGHLTPTLPLVEELTLRGHDVDYATSHEFSGAVTDAGARWVALPPMPPFRPPAEVGPDLIAFWFRHYFAAMEAAYPIALEHCRTTRPDEICYDVTNWPARLVAHQLGIPAVRLIPNLAENEAYSLDDQLTAGLDPDHPEMAALAGDCARFSAVHRVELDVAGTMDVAEALNLVFVPVIFNRPATPSRTASTSSAPCWAGVHSAKRGHRATPTGQCSTSPSARSSPTTRTSTEPAWKRSVAVPGEWR